MPALRLSKPPPPLLSFAGVARRVRDGARERDVLGGVSFDLLQGEGIGVYGERRSGKSTLARLAAAVDLPDRGSVRVQGTDVASMSSTARSRLLRGPLALLAGEQRPPAVAVTVMDHVALASGSAGLSLREARRRALAALDRVEVAGVSAEEMSGALPSSERARIMLAAAIVHEPKLLIVDEPAPLPSLLERQRFCALLRSIARERRMALLVLSEELSALQGIATLATLSAGELCSTPQSQSATVVELPRRRAGAESP